MTAFRTEFASIVALFFLSPLVLMAQTSTHATLIPLRGKQAETLLDRIDRTKLPKGAVTDFISQREFMLRAPGSQDLGIVAIYFHYEPSGPKPAPPEQCGVFFIPQEGDSTYVSVIGSDTQLGSSLCGGVRAVGVSHDPGSRPRLIFIFDATNMHGKQYPSPWVLSWNEPSGTYQLDMKTTTRLWDQKTAVTLPVIRQSLKQHD